MILYKKKEIPNARWGEWNLLINEALFTHEDIFF